LAQNTGRPKTKLVESAQEFFAMIMDTSRYEVIDIQPLGDEALHVIYRTPEELQDNHSFVNHILASQITSYARMIMYKYMSHLNWNQLIYTDTGMIIKDHYQNCST
jgi:hypothetical protein